MKFSVLKSGKLNFFKNPTKPKNEIRIFHSKDVAKKQKLKLSSTKKSVYCPCPCLLYLNPWNINYIALLFINYLGSNATAVITLTSTGMAR